MRTVVFAEKKHIDYIERYKLFLSPYITKDVVFCAWDPEEESFEGAVPDIYRCINAATDWRAIILADSDSANINEINPFDVSKAEKTDIEDGTAGAFHLVYDAEKQHYERLMAAYDTAAGKPVTRLATFLCSFPLDVEAEKPIKPKTVKDDEYTDNAGKTEEKIFSLYRAAARHKKMLRDEILGGRGLKAALPCEVICLSPRTIRSAAENDAERMKLSWKNDSSLRYKDFCDSNMYFDNMRFFAYDILPEDHANYDFDYLKFMYTLLIFAANDLPEGSTLPGRLYSLNSQCSKDKIAKFITEYDKKLDKTAEYIEKEIKEVEGDVPLPMSDEEAEQAFLSYDGIDVTYVKKINTEGLTADKKEYGLSGDCPMREDVLWDRQFQASREVIAKLAKQPKRSLDRAVQEFHAHNKEEDNRVLALNQFQTEDIEEYVNNQEAAMVGIETRDFYDVSRFDEELKKGSKGVKKVLETRMSRKTTLALGGAVTGAFALGFLMMLFYNKDLIAVPVSFLLFGIPTAAIAIVGIAELIMLRLEVGNAIEGYNSKARGAKEEIDGSMGQFSKYLTAAVRVMKGNSILNVKRNNDNIYKRKVRVLKGHIEIIRNRQSDVRALFGGYFLNEKSADIYVEPYDYNFDRAEDYDYPLPCSRDDYRIDFIQKKNYVYVPMDIVEGITMEMEEMYE